MAGNPLTNQGTLNRLRASIVFPSFPELNVTASYLGEEMIRLALEGDATTFIKTGTGRVTSPEPYQDCSIRINLLKTQALADAFKKKMERNTLMGDCTVRPDASPLSPYQIVNTGIMGVEPLDLNGKSAGWVVTVSGIYYINSDLWS
jgi:hypothetical protein